MSPLISRQIDTATRAAKVTALAAELQLIASMAQDHVQRYGEWQCDFQHAFEEVRARLNEAMKEAEQDGAGGQGVIDDLYEALDQLVKATGHLGPCPGTMDRARRALAKARGEDELLN